MKIACITPADTEISCGLRVDGLITFDSSSCCLFGASVSSHLLENVFELESIANMFYLQFHVVFYCFIPFGSLFTESLKYSFNLQGINK